MFQQNSECEWRLLAGLRAKRPLDGMGCSAINGTHQNPLPHSLQQAPSKRVAQLEPEKGCILKACYVGKIIRSSCQVRVACATAHRAAQPRRAIPKVTSAH